MVDSPEVLDDPRGCAPVPTRRLYRDVVVPRSILPLAWLYSVLLLPAYLLGTRARRRNRHRTPRVVVESGRIGWTQVFFGELLASAEDFFGADNVSRAVIDRDEPYLRQFSQWLKQTNPTHVVIDVRTPRQSWPGSLWDSLSVSWKLHMHGIYPIVIMTDAFYRRQRWHAGVLTAWTGTTVTFASRDLVRPIFAHGRVRGPLIMPISRARMAWLNDQKPGTQSHTGSNTDIAFVGNIYPPRSTFLDALAAELERRDLEFRIHGDKGNRSNEEYWQILAQADVIVTTTMQGPDRNIIDWNWIRQAVHRFSETFAAGTAVVGAPVDGGFPPFVDGTDYLEFGSVREAADAIERLANDPELRSRIAQQGRSTYGQLIESGAFWHTALGAD